MNYTSVESKLDIQKTWDFFTFVLAPFKVKTVIELTEKTIRGKMTKVNQQTRRLNGRY